MNMERGWRKSKTFAEACQHAAEGVWYALQRERNLQVQLLIYVAVLLLAWWLEVTVIGIVSLMLVAAFIMTLELMNTAIEVLANAITPQYHEGLRRAKDVAAGAVLIASITAVAVGLLLFIPQLL